MKKLTTEEFIQKVKEIHGDKYDYSKVEYVNNNTKVCIICHEKDEFGEEHGEFWKTPHNFLKPQFCPKCSKKAKIDLETFIKRAKAIHGDKYDYSKAKIVNVKTKVTIICPEHGEFQQNINKHIQSKQGCPICALKTIGNKRKSSMAEFIQKAQVVHRNMYNYDKVDYKRSDEKVCITCPKHGDFWQTPSHHLQGEGCPICMSSKGEIIINDYLSDLNIYFEREKCIYFNNISMRADFYLKLNNKKIIIEYHGKQHYVPIEYFGGQIKFEQQQIRDTTLREYCSINNIQLLELRYNLSKEEIIKSINNILNE